MAKLGETGDRERRPLAFPNWKQALEATALAPAEQQVQARAIIAFLGFCKRRHAPASIILIKEYLSHLGEQEANTARTALRWFVLSAERAGAAGELQSKVEVEGRRAEQAGAMGKPLAGMKPVLPGGGLMAGSPSTAGGATKDNKSQANNPTAAFPGGADSSNAFFGAKNARSRPYQRRQAATPPPLAANDQGGADWERDLIKACRERNFLWRTEETYRMWGARFARFLAPRSPYAAEASDVAAFLSRMAVEERASVSTQKQALNALVFLMQEGLHRQLGEIDFHRSQKPRRLPTVLSEEECLRLFAQLTGVTQLMAELAYGSGLRLLELLRLRIHHLDLDRLQVHVYSGKGDKDRITVLPTALVERLQEQRARLQVLFKADRAAGLPGVWLPEGLDRKYPNAGVSWEWQWVFPSREVSLDPATGTVRRHHVSDTPFQAAIRKAARAAGIDKRVTPHTLRHSFGTHMIEGGADIRTVQELMGHDSVETTQMYLHVMQKGIGAVSPLDKLKGRIPPAKPGLINPNWPLPPAGPAKG